MNSKLGRPPLWPPVNHNYHQCSHTCTPDQLSIPCTHLHSASTNNFAVMPGLTPSLPSHSSVMALWAMCVCVWLWAERYLKDLKPSSYLNNTMPAIQIKKKNWQNFEIMARFIRCPSGIFQRKRECEAPRYQSAQGNESGVAPMFWQCW